MSAARAVRKFLALPAVDELLLIRAGIALVGVRVVLRVAGFAATRGLLERRLGPRKVPHSIYPSADRIAWAIDTAGVHLPGCGNCLVKALAAQYLLRRFGYLAELKIGGRHTEAGEFTAHAWLEGGDKVIIGNFELDRYSAFTSLGDPTTKLSKPVSVSRSS